MTRKFVQLAIMAAGVALTMGSMTACGDDSTASAPITSNPVTTTSMYSDIASSSASAQPSESADDESTGTQTGASTGAAAGSQLPATAPKSTKTAEKTTGPDGEPLSPKAQKYLAALKSQNVSFMGDTDGSVALTMATYICAEQKKGTDPVTVKAYVTASVGPGTNSVAEANTKADKVIKAAQTEYC